MTTKEEYQKIFQSLPEDLREAIVSVNTAEIIQGLGKKYKLHVDKTAILGDEIGLVMFGLTNPKDFMINLKRRLEIPEDMARDLTAEINEQIFKSIRESLKKIHNLAREEESESSRPTTDDRQPTTKPIPELPKLGPEDNKILVESGIEIDQKPTAYDQQPTTNNSNIKRNELIEALENPAGIKKEEVAMPGGYSMIKSSLASPPSIVPPEQKLGSAVKAPATETTYVEKKPVTDPYREPIS